MIHPIETESYRILGTRVDLSHLDPGPRAVVERVIHASADPEYATSTVVDPAAVDTGVRALRAGAPVLCDVDMVRSGIRGVATECLLAGNASADPDGATRASSRSAASRPGSQGIRPIHHGECGQGSGLRRAGRGGGPSFGKAGVLVVDAGMTMT